MELKVVPAGRTPSRAWSARPVPAAAALTLAGSTALAGRWW
ncbi:hypothetical protein [Micromonospora sp. KC207]|nr:hypothetical protein [Micromonospora sp. KC207]